MESPKGLRSLKGDHITAAPPPLAGDRAWARAKRAQTSVSLASPEKEGPEYVFERFFGHMRREDGELLILVCWFRYTPQKDIWKRTTSPQGESVRKYCKRKGKDLPGLAAAGAFFCDTTRSQVRSRRDMAAKAPKEWKKRAHQRTSRLYAVVT